MSLLKISALTVSGVTLWLAPPFIFSRKIPLHNFLQGVALVSGFACAFEARRCALKVAKTEEFEAIKDAAVAADVVDEIATSAYISQQQRQQEAELILASPGEDVEANREALEAIYSQNLQDDTSTSEHPDYPMYLEICKSREAGKSTTWIVENVLKMGGRKFSEGKVKLQTLLNQFERDREK